MHSHKVIHGQSFKEQLGDYLYTGNYTPKA